PVPTVDSRALHGELRAEARYYQDILDGTGDRLSSPMQHIEQRPLGARGLREVQLQLVGPSQ
ncbi:hypothetical protein KI387_030031, partial [Taxus chinensis]